jgi:hypothetical protein
MPNSHFVALEEGEPKGADHGEPREDNMSIVIVDGEPEYWKRDDNGERACGAKRTGWQDHKMRCRAFGNLDNDNNRCQHHGGTTPRGLESPHFQHGGYSQYLPDSLGDRMDDFMKDPNIASVREELALLGTRLSSKLEELEDGPSRDLWEQLEDAVDELEAARRRGDGDAVAACLNQITRLVRNGAQEQEKWEDVFDIVEQRRKLAETENKRMKQSSNTLTVEEASMLVEVMTGTVMDILEQYDVPPDAYEQLNNATRRLLDQ